MLWLINYNLTLTGSFVKKFTNFKFFSKIMRSTWDNRKRFFTLYLPSHQKYYIQKKIFFINYKSRKQHTFNRWSSKWMVFSDLSRAFYLTKIFFSTTIAKQRLQLLYPTNFSAFRRFLEHCQIFENMVEKSMFFCKNRQYVSSIIQMLK